MDNLCCWNCGADVSDEPMPLSRQASCQKCGEFLHCCRLCIHFAPGQPNDCSNDLAEPPTDKTSANFCEFFVPKQNAQLSNQATNQDVKAKLDDLFGDTEPANSSDNTGSGNPLDDLFND